jgi:hypothetical protein
MEKEKPKERLHVAPTTHAFEWWLSQSFLSDETRSVAQQANILLVPDIGFRGGDSRTFPVGTEEVLLFLRDNAPSEAVCEICIDDEDYRELALHSGLLIVAGFVVTSVLAPVLVSLLSKYFERRVYDETPSRSASNVRVKITIAHPDGRSVRISYDGPASEFKTAMLHAFSAPTDSLPAISTSTDVRDEPPQHR